jgi:hypothetical protein
MASTYFENIDFYRNLLPSSLSKGDERKDASLTFEIANDASDTTICARIRPLSEEEERSQHISGILSNGTSKAVLYEPRKKFNGTPDANVRLSRVRLNWCLRD